MKWIARICVFISAVVFGAWVASIFAPKVTKPSTSSGLFSGSSWTQYTAQNLRGKWVGNWGRDHGDCTLFIDEVSGNAFAGTLTKGATSVRFEGSFDPRTRKLTFQETEVISPNAEESEWSLGTNNGLLSEDGRILVGDGFDEDGQYGWGASNY